MSILGFKFKYCKRNVETIITNIDNSDELEQSFIEESKQMAIKFARLMRGTASSK